MSPHPLSLIRVRNGGRSQMRERSRSMKSRSAIDLQVHACDEACFFRREEQGGRRDLLGRASRHGSGELRAGFLGCLFCR